MINFDDEDEKKIVLDDVEDSIVAHAPTMAAAGEALDVGSVIRVR